jgi:hypothetical protein
MTEEATPIRGAVRVQVSTSTEGLVAGSSFSVFVKIQNPFEVALTVHRVSTFLPTEVLDVDACLREERAATLERELMAVDQDAKTAGLEPMAYVPRRVRNSRWKRFIWRVGIPGISLEYGGTAVAREVGTVQLGGMSLEMAHVPDRGSTKDALAAERGKYLASLEALEHPADSPELLQPGNSSTRVFTLKTRRWFLFRPASYQLQIKIEYEIGGLGNVDTVEHVLPVKAAVGSMVAGSVLGSMAGWFTAKGGQVNSPGELLGGCVTLVLSAMGVVLFARKKDVQPLIAIEDFWGGVAVGFLIAYSGPRVISGLLGGQETESR